MAEPVRPDLSAFGGLGALAGAAEHGPLLRQVRERAERTREIREKVRDLVGRAASDDGNVKAAYTDADGLSELTLEPKAMRLPSQDLAALIVTLSAEARADLDRQRAEALAELDLGGAPFDLESSQAMLAELSNAYAGSMSEIQAVFAQFRDRRR
jgi:YbaB/EbfC DNA-binding family protein